MFKILFILSLIVLSSTGFTSQQNEHELIPFIVLSSTGFTAPKNVDVLQEQGNMPKQAITKSRGTIFKSGITNNIFADKVLIGLSELFVEITRTYEEIKKLELSICEPVTSKLNPTMSIVYKTIGEKAQIKSGASNEGEKYDNAADLHLILNYLTVEFDNFSTLGLNIDFNIALRLMDELRTNLDHIYIKTEEGAY